MPFATSRERARRWIVLGLAGRYLLARKTLGIRDDRHGGPWTKGLPQQFLECGPLGR
jgi:hypothetical protein